MFATDVNNGSECYQKYQIKTFLHIKTFSEKKISLDVQPSNTIIDIKEKIKEKENIHSARQKLLFQGTELVDNKTLVDYNNQFCN